MTIRKLTYNEAKELFDRLLNAGYPAQIYYSDDRWRVLVTGVIVNESKVDLDKL